jgi:hypothetical protein
MLEFFQLVHFLERVLELCKVVVKAHLFPLRRSVWMSKKQLSTPNFAVFASRIYLKGQLFDIADELRNRILTKNELLANIEKPEGCEVEYFNKKFLIHVDAEDVF